MPEEEREGVGAGAKGEVVQAGLQGVRGVVGAQAQRMEDGHEDCARAGARVRLRSEGDFACDDERPQPPLGQVIVGRDGGVAGPRVEPRGVLSEDLLPRLDRRVSGRVAGDGLDAAAQRRGLAREPSRTAWRSRRDLRRPSAPDTADGL